MFRHAGERFQGAIVHVLRSNHSSAAVGFCATWERGHLPAPSSARQAGPALVALLPFLPRHGADVNQLALCRSLTAIC